MRIISGKAGGIRLHAPEGDALRPTEDRVKEALFASLGDIRGLRVLDLYSGSGALGLEALSRGAAEVIMVEKNLCHFTFIEKNLAAVLKSMDSEIGKSRILLADVRDVPHKLAEFSRHIDLILADPPYAPLPGNFAGKELLLCADFANWCGEQVKFILEHQSDSQLPWYPQSAWRLERQKRFARRSISWLRLVQ